jgi:tetratricopeptide (TPR) repeat protein
MSQTKYESFDLTIEPRLADGRYRVKVDTVLGQDSDYMRLPQSFADLRDLMGEAVEEVRGLRRVEREIGTAVQTPTKELGSILFDSLLHGRVSNMYWKCLGRIETRQDLGLRITLHMDPEHPSLAELASLPWELLFMKERRTFLSQSMSTPIVRFLDVPRPVIPLPLQLPLRVLVCMSSPVDQEQLNLEKERNLIERNLGDRQDIQIKFLPHTRPERLHDELSSNPPHVLHFMGHGGFIEDSGQGVLLLEDLHGKSRPLSGEHLGMLLENKPTRLVFLNACDTARAATQAGHDPFSGVATALVMKGILAVVAMQFPISDGAAIAFTKRVYELLAQGFPIDAAAAEGRQSIILNESGSMEWATPVLFMRTSDGVLFVPRKAPEPPTPQPPETVPPPSVPASSLYWRGVSRARQGRWREAMELFQRVVAVDADYRDVQERLAEAKGHVEREETLVGLYATARDLTLAGEWLAVVALFDEIHDLEPDYPDPEGLLGTAFHGQALELMDAGKWPEAVERLERVCTLLPKHPDAPALLEHARLQEAIAPEPEKPSDKRFPTRLVAAGGAVIAVLVAIFVIIANIVDGCAAPPPTHTPAATSPLKAADTPRPTPRPTETSGPATAAPNRTATAAFLTRRAEGAAADTPAPPTDTPVPPTDTPVPPTDTPVPPTDTPVPPTDTPVPQPYAIIPVGGLNIRRGPGTAYEVLGFGQTAQRFDIVGRNAAGDWWQVCCLEGARGWVFAELAQSVGPTDTVTVTTDIPVLPVPAAPIVVGPPTLVEPADGSRFEGDTTVTFSWDWSGMLAANHWFDVNFRQDGGTAFQHAKDMTLTLGEKPLEFGSYEWWVRIAEFDGDPSAGGQFVQHLGGESQRWQFHWDDVRRCHTEHYECNCHWVTDPITLEREWACDTCTREVCD